MNLSEVYDGRELHWTEDATALLDSSRSGRRSAA
jgi:hypothetical protein